MISTAAHESEVLLQDAQAPEHLKDILEKVRQLHREEVAPREASLAHRLSNEREFLDSDGRLHPEIVQARREIMRAAGKKVSTAHTFQSTLAGSGWGVRK